MILRDRMEAIYREIPAAEIPWNLEEPPGLLVDRIESGAWSPCDAVDLGCGAGNHAVWLASRGFRVTGIDLSRRAVEMAEELARSRGLDCRFVAADLLDDLEEFAGAFDLALEWSLLHHVFPDDREKYVRNVSRMLRPGASYLSVCFSERDTGFGGSGKYRRTPLDTVLYFSSEEEVRDLFEPLFRVRDLSTVQIEGKYGPHTAVVAFLERKEGDVS